MHFKSNKCNFKSSKAMPDQADCPDPQFVSDNIQPYLQNAFLKFFDEFDVS